MIKRILLIVAVLASCAFGADRPNVIVIMADDIGAEGLGCYGSTIYTTPTLDQMAREGLRFNNAYLMGTDGRDRDHVLVNLKKGYFVRDARFRLNQDGKLYDIPITSDKERYSEHQAASSDFSTDRERLQPILNAFMSIESEYKPADEDSSKDSRRKKKSAQ
ncbi:MAG: sulfatase-like hydrolase/transferase [Phycisphaera sp.]|nr:sulfatase-like hydrolase/transferase [Phycisphaera sp.]